MKIQYYKELDGIRAIAALMVMFFHFFQVLETDSNNIHTIKKIATFGQTGVSLFFVLSGFLITRILFQAKNGNNFFLHFYIRRSLRIFPLYYFFLVLYYFIIPFIRDTPFVPFGSQIYYWVYLQNFASTFNWKAEGPAHFWSLAVEEHFYLFWPLLIYLFSIKQMVYVIIGIISIALFTRILLANNNLEVFYFTFSRMDELAIGAILAILELKNKLIKKNSYHFLILLSLIIIPTLFIWIVYNGERNLVVQVLKFTLLSLSYFSLIGYIITIKETHWIKRVLNFNTLSYSGKISYGLYVYHPLCFYLLTLFYKSDYVLINLILSFLITYLIAALSFQFFESKFLKLKQYYI